MRAALVSAFMRRGPGRPGGPRQVAGARQPQRASVRWPAGGRTGLPAAPRLGDELEALVTARARSSRLLFLLDHPGFLLHFDETIAALSRAGNTVELAFARPDKWPHGLEALDESDPRIVRHGRVPPRATFPRAARSVRRLGIARWTTPTDFAAARCG